MLAEHFVSWVLQKWRTPRANAHVAQTREALIALEKSGCAKSIPWLSALSSFECACGNIEVWKAKWIEVQKGNDKRTNSARKRKHIVHQCRSKGHQACHCRVRNYVQCDRFWGEKTNAPTSSHTLFRGWTMAIILAMDLLDTIKAFKRFFFRLRMKSNISGASRWKILRKWKACVHTTSRSNYNWELFKKCMAIFEEISVGVCKVFVGPPFRCARARELFKQLEIRGELGFVEGQSNDSWNVHRCACSGVICLISPVSRRECWGIGWCFPRQRWGFCWHFARCCLANGAGGFSICVAEKFAHYPGNGGCFSIGGLILKHNTLHPMNPFIVCHCANGAQMQKQGSWTLIWFELFPCCCLRTIVGIFYCVWTSSGNWLIFELW